MKNAIKMMISGMLIIMLLLGMVGCGGIGSADDSRQPEEAAGEESLDKDIISFTDDAGRTVEIPAQIDRIIPTGILSQLILYSVAPRKLIGLASKWNESAKGIISDEAYNLPYFGQFYGNADMNIEELAKAAPELVIDIGESKDQNVEELDDFTAKTGIPIVFIYADLESMDSCYEKLGALLGEEEKAGKLSDFCKRTYQRTLDIMEQVGDNKVTSLYIQGDVGLNVVAKGSFHAEILDLLTENLAVVDNPSGKGLGNEVSMEQIALWNPEFLIFGMESIYGEVQNMPVWNEMKAIQNGSYVETPYVPYCWLGMPPSVQRYLALLWLPSILYPEYCNYDLKEEVKEYYSLFYGCELTDEQYEEITANGFL